MIKNVHFNVDIYIGGEGESSPKTFSWLGLNEVRERLLKRRGAVRAKRTLDFLSCYHL